MISATRAPGFMPRLCSQAPMRFEYVSSSPNVMDLSMHTKALRFAYFWNDSSSRCTSERYWFGSMSAGTPGGYDFNQILSMLCLLSPFYCRATVERPAVMGRRLHRAGGLSRCRLPEKNERSYYL